MTEKKKDMLIRRTKELVQEYLELDINITIRQIYYRLVVNKEIELTRSQYVYFDKVITDYRKNHLNFADLFTDDARKIKNKSEINYPFWKFTELINNSINKVKTDYPQVYYNENLLQNKINIILLEKQALYRIFKKGITSNTILVPAKGLNSFSQMNELRHLLENENRELKLYCFTDFDDTGMLIQDNFIEQMELYLNINFDSIERIALTKEQIEQYNIPINPLTKPMKQSKSTHKDYGLPYFVELDALEPLILVDLVRKTCEQNYDKDLFKSIDKAMIIRNRRLKTKYFKELKKIDMTKI